MIHVLSIPGKRRRFEPPGEAEGHILLFAAYSSHTVSVHRTVVMVSEVTGRLDPSHYLDPPSPTPSTALSRLPVSWCELVVLHLEPTLCI